MSLQHLILGLLSEEAMTGYDLNKAFQQTAQHFWTTDQSGIYRALYKLRDSGMVTQEVIAQDDNPDKKLYSVTDSGLDELRRWLSTPLPPDSFREAWLGQVFFAEQISPGELRQVLHAYADEAAANLEMLTAIHSSVMNRLGGAEPSERGYYRLMTLDYGIRIHQTTLDWLRSVIAELDARESGGGR